MSRFGYVGCMFLALVLCSLTGCVMPSRESLKEPGWNPGNGQAPTAGRAVRPTPLIKPFIPPDQTDRGPGGPVGMRTEPPAPLTVAGTQSTNPAPPVNQDIATNQSAQPVPSPLRWHDPSQDRSTYARPPSQQPFGQLPAEPDRPVPQMQQRVDGPNGSLARAEASPFPQPAPQAVQPSRPHQVAFSPAPSSQAVPAERNALKPVSSPPAPLQKPEPSMEPAPTAPQAAVEAKSGSRQWEDQRVKQAAASLAKKFPGVKKGKICYSVKTDEWWVVLYDDSGAVYDVKQYTWNRDQEKLERFLVLRRIGKNRLEEDLNVREADRSCEPIDFP